MTGRNFDDLKPEQRATIPPNLLTQKGNPRCRFELLIRWPDSAGRKINPFTYRGDNFGIIEHDKMLCSLLRLFIKDNHKWHFAELYDNIYPFNDCKRLVLELKSNRIVTNRLKDYEDLLRNFPLPAWLQMPASKY